MRLALTGVLRGATITLDVEVPALDGRRVRVFLEPEAPDRSAGENDNQRVWREWVAKGPHGPIDGAEDDAFPDEA
jgi:hypothetical protein